MTYPWQKVYEQHPTIGVSKIIEEAPALEGFTGSWAASYTNGLAVQSELIATEPGHSPARVNKIGLPGLPEINFAPYSANTNRFGVKGPSLIGHPISYSVVGPTLKSQFVDWQWLVFDNSALPGGDVLTIDIVNVIDGGAPIVSTIPAAYGISLLDLSEYDGGLYLTISQTGEKGLLEDANDGGLWDGYIAPIGTRIPITSKTPSSKFEIFRIESIAVGGTSFVLDPRKRLKDYFDIPAFPANVPIARGVTVFEPKVARLAAVPTVIPPSPSTIGREQVFATVPPRIAATSDLLPPYGTIATNGTWLGGNCDSFNLTGSTQKGMLFSYTEGVRLPIPLPLEDKPRTARAESLTGVLPIPGAAPVLGKFTLVDLSGLASNADVGKIIRIFKVETVGDVVFKSPSNRSVPTSPEDFLGWYEIHEVVPVLPYWRYSLRRVTEVDPSTGRLVYGLQEALTLEATSSVDAQVTLHFTMHDNVRSLFTADPFDAATADKLSAARLTNLIDPEWVGRSVTEPNPLRTVVVGSAGGADSISGPAPDMTLNVASGPFLPSMVGSTLFINNAAPADNNGAFLITAYVSPTAVVYTNANGTASAWAGPGKTFAVRRALADGAIFDTRSSSSNPGSLLDLGFRMVLFPAKALAGVGVAPDFENPIDPLDPTASIVLDPSKPNERQFITVDYSSGVVTLSHLPVPGPGCTVAPNGIVPAPVLALIEEPNPRDEIVLFASFVPYSLEAGQRGASIRVTGLATQPETPVDPLIQSDVFSGRVVLAVDASQTITSGTGYGPTQELVIIVPSGQYDSLPETGFFELLTNLGDPVFLDTSAPRPNRASTFGYVRKRYIDTGINGNARFRLYGVHGGGVDLASVTRDDLVIVIRRDALLTRTDFPFVPYQQDVSYGGAKRTNTIRFTGTTLTPNADGSVSVERDTSGDGLFDDLFRSWVLSGGATTDPFRFAANDNRVKIAATRVLFRGRSQSLAAGFITGLADDATFYIYVDSTSPSLAYNTVTTLPLPEKDDILISKFVTDSTVPVGPYPVPVSSSDPPYAITDLRYPLAKVDKRLDLIVGTHPGPGGPSWTDYTTPHFTTLADAVDYASEIMMPVTTGSLSGPGFRIRVVGGTVEGRPVVIKTDGLIIEGNPRQVGPPSDIPLNFAIGFQKGPLIDLNGHNDLVFRDLSFACLIKPTDLPNLQAFVFGCTPPRYADPAITVERVHIDNCRVFDGGPGFGYPLGFIFSDPSESAVEILSGTDADITGGTGAGTIFPVNATYTWNGSNTVTTTDTSEFPGPGPWGYIRLDTDGRWFEIVAVTLNTSITVAGLLGPVSFPTGQTQSSRTAIVAQVGGTWTGPPAVLPGDIFYVEDPSRPYRSSVISETDGATIVLNDDVLVPAPPYTWKIIKLTPTDKLVWKDCSFTRNQIQSRDFGIYLGWVTQGCRIENNIIKSSGDGNTGSGVLTAPITSTPYSLAGITLAPQTTAPGAIPEGFFSTTLDRQVRNVIRGNHIYGTLQAVGPYAPTNQKLSYLQGIVTYGLGDIIEGNHIQDTKKRGIYINVPDACVVRDNLLEGIWGHIPEVASVNRGTVTLASGVQPAPGASFTLTVAGGWIPTLEPAVGTILYVQDAGFYTVLSTTATTAVVTNLNWPSTSEYPVLGVGLALVLPRSSYVTAPKIAVDVAGGQDMLVGHGALPVAGEITLDANDVSIYETSVVYVPRHQGISVRRAYSHIRSNTIFNDNIETVGARQPRITSNRVFGVRVQAVSGISNKAVIIGNQVSQNIQFLAPTYVGPAFTNSLVSGNEAFVINVDFNQQVRVIDNYTLVLSVAESGGDRNIVQGNRVALQLKVFGTHNTIQGNSVGFGSTTGTLWHGTSCTVMGNVVDGLRDTIGGGGQPAFSSVVGNQIFDTFNGWYTGVIPAPLDPDRGFNQ